jgi:hypothetical protein
MAAPDLPKRALIDPSSSRRRCRAPRIHPPLCQCAFRQGLHPPATVWLPDYGFRFASSTAALFIARLMSSTTDGPLAKENSTDCCLPTAGSSTVIFKVGPLIPSRSTDTDTTRFGMLCSMRRLQGVYRNTFRRMRCDGGFAWPFRCRACAPSRRVGDHRHQFGLRTACPPVPAVVVRYERAFHLLWSAGANRISTGQSLSLSIR